MAMRLSGSFREESTVGEGREVLLVVGLRSGDQHSKEPLLKAIKVEVGVEKKACGNRPEESSSSKSVVLYFAITLKVVLSKIVIALSISSNNN